jgi:hypothetical protein
MTTSPMATYQFSNAELTIIKDSLEYAKKDCEANLAKTILSDMIQTINQILAARNTRG